MEVSPFAYLRIQKKTSHFACCHLQVSPILALENPSSTILTKAKFSYFSWCSKAEDAVLIHCLDSCNQQQMLGSKLEHRCLTNIKSSNFFLT